jgi:hypothetical protein
MGGGHFNGKNHGGEHTGDGKKAKCGPYSSNGYRPNTQISHLDFIPTEHVIYTGTSKNKSKHYIPNGTEGVILEDDTYNKLQKVPRSVLKVDFGKKGIRYVHKNVLQHVEGYGEYIEGLLDTPSMFDGYQAYRNDKKKDVKEKLRPERYEQILKNRRKNAEFREWRKGYLHNKEVELYDHLNNIQSKGKYKEGYDGDDGEAYLKTNESTKSYNEDKKSYYEQHRMKIDRRKKLKDELDGLVEEHIEEDKLPDEFDDVEGKKGYYKQRRKEEERIKVLKNDLYILENYFNTSNDSQQINELLHSKSRQFVRHVSSKQDYNNYLHCIKSCSDYDYKHTLLKPSRDYSVIESDKVAKEPTNLNLILWGLNPRDVKCH